jgi:hypothetical protein
MRDSTTSHRAAERYGRYLASEDLRLGLPQDSEYMLSSLLYSVGVVEYHVRKYAQDWTLTIDDETIYRVWAAYCEEHADARFERMGMVA